MDAEFVVRRANDASDAVCVKTQIEHASQILSCTLGHHRGLQLATTQCPPHFLSGDPIEKAAFRKGSVLAGKRASTQFGNAAFLQGLLLWLSPSSRANLGVLHCRNGLPCTCEQ